MYYSNIPTQFHCNIFDLKIKPRNRTSLVRYNRKFVRKSVKPITIVLELPSLIASEIEASPISQETLHLLSFKSEIDVQYTV